MTKSPLFRKIFRDIEKKLTGQLNNQIGETFEKFFKQLLVGAEYQVHTGQGKSTIDYVWKGFAIELKTAVTSMNQAQKTQLRRHAQYAAERSRTLVYIYLKKPQSVADLKRLEEAGAQVIYLFE